ncbi:DUF1819 family protein [Verrucomicrobiales bacterium]|nr:DUF1819 family protein [Verrucomicrobiales bacterium]MDC0275415.1 DUF1819 family protein [Verrucomicrobiales bacterium]
MGNKRYTTQLGAGLGMIPETIELLRIWDPKFSATSFANFAVSDGVFSSATARRTRNIVMEMFAPRFMADGKNTAKRFQFLLNNQFPIDGLAQLFYIQTARAQEMLADFVTEVYWPRYSAGAGNLNWTDAFDFIIRALDNGFMEKRWSDSTIKKNSGYLVSACADFGLLDEGRGKTRSIQHFSLRQEVALYLLHDLHFSGLGDMNVAQHHDWALFGLELGDVIQLVIKLGNDGHLVAQSSGTVIQISWKYKTMEECLNALVKR